MGQLLKNKNDNNYDSVMLEFKTEEDAESWKKILEEFCIESEKFNDIFVNRIVEDVQLIGSTQKLMELIKLIFNGEDNE